MILEALKKQNHLQAMGVLDERIKQCEACELLATKSLGSMTKEMVTETLSCVIEVASFPPFVQQKVADFYLLQKCLAPLKTILGKKDLHPSEDEIVACMRTMGRSLCWPTKEELRTKKMLEFNVVDPSLGALFYGLTRTVKIECAAEEMDAGGSEATKYDVDFPEFDDEKPKDGQLVLLNNKKDIHLKEKKSEAELEQENSELLMNIEAI